LPGYQVKHENIAVQGVEALHIRSLLDRQQYFDPLGEAEALGVPPAGWPLFGLLWPSGQILAGLMAARSVSTERILELGCGLGLASMVAHRRGANVTASDFHPLAGSFLNENLHLNNLAPLPFVRTGWQDDCPALGRFDLIIGSDVLYERDEEGSLANFIELHACPQAQVTIVDPDRGNRPHFNRHMAKFGFTLSETRADCTQPDGNRYKGRILRYRR
jgi:predicted nicotinamide N-methyase